MRTDRYDRSALSPLSFRRPARALGLASLLALALLATLGGGGCGSEQPKDEFNGTVLKGAEPAPAFSLTNHLDRPVSLESLRGKVVVLTFLYTYCPDVCPIITTQLRDVRAQLEGRCGRGRVHRRQRRS